MKEIGFQARANCFVEIDVRIVSLYRSFDKNRFRARKSVRRQRPNDEITRILMGFIIYRDDH